MLLRTLRYFISVDHVAFIMDGNRRYARHLGLNVAQGHHDGLTKLFEIIEVCHLLGVRVVTVYAFSLQNFSRSVEEISHLISLAADSAGEGGSIRDFALRDSCRIRFCGDLSLVNEELQQLLAEVEADTAHFKRFTLNICMCYGARNDIASALKDSTNSEDERCAFVFGVLIAGLSYNAYICI
ncbi:undecaprenyl diphosphate synthase [Babesia ovata]|uniref:Alkyl transferase n=1 Tax=Babesia ovata TaxID=189622 RepID=A0A2H6KHS7_9APIC|nr:undecaprenyl diphosphate synthase [Babesia ovata]GBE62546.1 undecaprenyl diphosphate synthase [Babesia ovata]